MKFIHSTFIIFILMAVISACSTKTSDSSKTSQALPPPPPKKVDLFIGTYTDKNSEGIYHATFDQLLGELSGLRLLAESPNPSYLAVAEDRLYAVSEQGDGMVTAYNRVENGLEMINQLPVAGDHPCYVDFNNQKNLVAVANYSSGNGVVYRVGEDGSLGDELFKYQHKGSGADENRQEAPHAHCAIFSPDDRYMYVVDLGIDQVVGYPLDGEKTGEPFIALELEPGDGPRHLVFHPTRNHAFVINELSSTVNSMTVDTTTGVFTTVDRKSTLPETFTEHNQCADIHVSSDGRFLYASNRGHNSIAVFRVNANGTLKFMVTTETQGEWPRNFALSPNQEFLLVANKDTDNITIFSRDQKTGLLTYSGKQLEVSKPVCLEF